MNIDENLFLTAPDDLSDEAAAQLLEFLYAAAAIVENRYFAQLRRYHSQNRVDKRQLALWDELPWDDPPF